MKRLLIIIPLMIFPLYAMEETIEQRIESLALEACRCQLIMRDREASAEAKEHAESMYNVIKNHPLFSQAKTMLLSKPQPREIKPDGEG